MGLKQVTLTSQNTIRFFRALVLLAILFVASLSSQRSALAEEGTYEVISPSFYYLPSLDSSTALPATDPAINDKGAMAFASFVLDSHGAVIGEPNTFPGNSTYTDILDSGEVIGTYVGCAGITNCYNHPIGVMAEELDFPQAASESGYAVGICYESTSFSYFSAAACGADRSELQFFNLLNLPPTAPFLPQVLQRAMAVNEAGMVTGAAAVQTDPSILHAFRGSFANSTVEDLGTLGGENSEGRAINSHGVIVGSSQTAGGAEAAFRVDAGSSVMEPVFEPGSVASSSAFGISDVGEILGAFTATDAAAPNGFLIDAEGDLFAANDLLHPTLQGTHNIVSLHEINVRSEIAAIRQQLAAGPEAPSGPSEVVLLRPLVPSATVNNFQLQQAALPLGELVVWRPSDGTWISRSVRSFDGYMQRQWGLPGDLPLFHFDRDGDKIPDLVVWRPTTGDWYFCLSTVGFNCAPTPTQFGLPGDVPVTLDYDGDGKHELAVFRPYLALTGEVATWYLRLSSTQELVVIQWGLFGDIPVPADYDGDSKTDIAVFRPSTAEWFFLLSTRNYRPDQYLLRQWGLIGDEPMPRDMDADGRDDIVVYRRSTGFWWTCVADGDFSCFLPDGTTRLAGIQWGLAGDRPLLANFLGSKAPPLAVYREIDASVRLNGGWIVRHPQPMPYISYWGLPGDIPSGIGIVDRFRALRAFHPALYGGDL